MKKVAGDAASTALFFGTQNEVPDRHDPQVALLEAKPSFVVTRANLNDAWNLRNGPLHAPRQLLPEDDTDVIREDKYKRYCNYLMRLQISSFLIVRQKTIRCPGSLF